MVPEDRDHWGCVGDGTIQHETMHALGFLHEQSRSDRDNYVVVHYENIHESKIPNFKKLDESEWVNLDIAYDIGSVMQYSGWYYTHNGKPSITVLDENGIDTGKERFCF